MKSAATYDNKIAYCRNKAIFVNDCVTSKQLAVQTTNGNINHLAFKNESVIIAANEKWLSFVDYRNNAKSVNFDLTKTVARFSILNDNLIMYGCMDGELGVIDRRMPRKSRWSTTATHKAPIYDICQMGDTIVTGDKGGQLASWQPLEAFPSTRSEIVA